MSYHTMFKAMNMKISAPRMTMTMSKKTTSVLLKGVQFNYLNTSRATFARAPSFMASVVTNIMNNSSILGGSNTSSSTDTVTGASATEGASSSTTAAASASSGEATGSASSSTMGPGRRRIT